MVTLKSKVKNKEGNIEEVDIFLVPKTKKVIVLTEKLKAKSLNDLLFKGLNDGNLNVLAIVIQAFAEKEDGSQAFFSLENVYEFIDDYVASNNCSYQQLFEEVIKVTNEMGFLKAKMEETKLNGEIKNPISSIDLNEIIANSAQKAVETIAEEEFRGYKG